MFVRLVVPTRVRWSDPRYVFTSRRGPFRPLTSFLPPDALRPPSEVGGHRTHPDTGGLGGCVEGCDPRVKEGGDGRRRTTPRRNSLSRLLHRKNEGTEWVSF